MGHHIFGVGILTDCFCRKYGNNVNAYMIENNQLTI